MWGGLPWSFARRVDKILFLVKPARSLSLLLAETSLFLNGAEEKDKWVEYTETNLMT